MAIDRSDFYVRVGEAAGAGAPIGASIDIARAATTGRDAAAAGRAFAAGDSFVQPGSRIDSTGAVVEDKVPTFWDKVGGVVSGVGRPVLRALEWGTEATGNIMEASLRTADERQRDGFQLSDVTMGLTAGPVWGWTQADWRENWNKAVDANASVGQTAWLLAEQQLNDRFGTAGTSGSGLQDPMTGEVIGDRVRSGGLDLLDDPNRYAERGEYFSEGAAHWTTGIGDALWQVFMDPLLAAGAVGAGIRTSRKMLDAGEVARVADRTVDAAQLSGRERKARDLVHDFAKSFEDAENGYGAVTAASRSRFLRNSTNAHSIAYLMNRAGEGIDDVAERIAAREDVVYAGMGDSEALARLAQRSGELEVELRKLQGGLDDVGMAADEALVRVDLADEDAIADAYVKLNDAPLAARELDISAPQIRRELAAIEKVIDAGSPVRGLTTAKAGDLAVMPGARDIAKVARTINRGPLLEPLNFVTGMHLPGTFQLSADDAPAVFHAAVTRARSLVPKGGDRAEEFTTRLLQLEDEFLAAGVGAESKAPRGAIMSMFDELVDDIIASKHGIEDRAALHRLYQQARNRRKVELHTIASRVYKAQEAGAAPAVNTGDGIFVFAGQPKWVTDLGAPVARSQLSDYVSIIDPRKLDRIAASHLKNGLEGYVRRLPETQAWEVSEHGLNMTNRLWKFGALLRPGAYFVRSQIDTQGRLLAMMGPLKYLAYAQQGTRNTVLNLRKADRGQVLALTARAQQYQRIDAIERILTYAGQDVEKLAPTPKLRAQSLETRMAELRTEKGSLAGFNARHEPDAVAKRLTELENKLAALGPKATKTRARLEAQRAKLLEGAQAWERAARLDDELRELSAQVAEIKGAPADRITMMIDELRELRDQVTRPLEFNATGSKVRLKDTALAARVGKTSGVDLKGNWRSAKVTDAYWDNDEFRRVSELINAEDSILGLMVGATRAELDGLRGTGHWDLIQGSRPEWEDAFLRAVNHQLRADGLGRRLLEGATDDDVALWFRHDPEGRAYLRDMRSAGSGDAERVVSRLREHIDTLMPEGTPVRAAAQRRAVTMDDIADTWQVKSHRPQVPGEILQPGPLHGPIMRKYQQIERAYFKWTASIPEHMMGRHPFYAARFNEYARKQLKAAGGVDEATLSLEDINKIRVAAAKMARNDVARYLFDTSKQSNIGHAVRFLSPFYGAWEDTMVKWSRIFGRNPAAAPAFWDVVRSPNAAGMVEDRDGNKIDPLGNVIDKDGNLVDRQWVWDGYVLLPIPDVGPGAWLRERTGASSIRVAKNAANIVFQGDPFWLPGPGPIMAVPVNELIVGAFPDAYGDEGNENALLRWILPFGPTDDPVIEQWAPSWAKAAKDVLTQDGDRVTQVFTQLYAEQVNAERNGETKPLADDERLALIENRVRNWTVLRLIGTQMPMTYSPTSRLAHYKTEYDRYRRTYGAGADDRFLQDYPDYFDMAISLSVNETGLTATDESWGAIQQYRRDIAQHPEYGWFWAGAANYGEGFSSGVYAAQKRQAIGPGTDTRFRTTKQPLEAIRDTHVTQGWREYQTFMTGLRLRMEELGLTSLNQNDASELRQIRTEFLMDLQKANPDWAAEFNSGGNPTGKVTEFLSLASEQLVTHKSLLERGDGLALAQYLTLREQMQATLEERAAAGGSRSLNSSSNADLRGIWDEFTTELVASDIGFEQMWNRVLGENAEGELRDDLTGRLYAREGGGE